MIRILVLGHAREKRKEGGRGLLFGVAMDPREGSPGPCRGLWSQTETFQVKPGCL